VLATAGELPAGAARTLFGGIVRLVRHLAEHDGEGRPELIAEVVPAACRGARELAHLDAALLLLEGEQAAEIMGRRGELEQRRDRLAQCLLDTQAALLRIVTLPLGEESSVLELRRLISSLGFEAEGKAAVRELSAGTVVGSP
jgi:hypothetical protein